jgi:hypothetical protein
LTLLGVLLGIQAIFEGIALLLFGRAHVDVLPDESATTPTTP